MEESLLVSPAESLAAFYWAARSRVGRSTLRLRRRQFIMHPLLFMSRNLSVVWSGSNIGTDTVIASDVYRFVTDLSAV